MRRVQLCVVDELARWGPCQGAAVILFAPLPLGTVLSAFAPGGMIRNSSLLMSNAWVADVSRA